MPFFQRLQHPRSALLAALLPPDTRERLRLVAMQRGLSTGAVAAEILSQIAPDTVAFTGPHGVRLRMARIGGGGVLDQGAAHVAQGGWQTFEPPLPSVLTASLDEWPGRMLDAGANSGFYSLLAASVPGCRQVIACEPDPAVAALLRRNIALNQGGENKAARPIVVRALALSDRAGTARLFVPDPGHRLVETSASLDPDFSGRAGSSVVVPTRRLDAVLGRGEAVSVIKIDVEGHESAVLRGAEATIRRARPLLFVEILHRADIAFMNRFVAAHDYVDVPLAEHGPIAPVQAVSYVPSAWNHAFVPRERLARFLELAKAK